MQGEIRGIERRGDEEYWIGEIMRVETNRVLDRMREGVGEVRNGEYWIEEERE